MNTEGLSEVAVKEAQPVVEQVVETPPEPVSYTHLTLPTTPYV